MDSPIERSPASAIHRGGLYILMAAVALQLALAGGGAFGAPAWQRHVLLGLVVATIAAVVLVAAVVARSDRTLLLGSVAVGGLAILQPLLSVLAQRVDPWFGLLHALDAGALIATLAILAVGSARVGSHPRLLQG